MNKLLWKIDGRILFVLSILFSIGAGIGSANMSLQSTKIVNGFSMDIFVRMLIYYGIFWIFFRLYKISYKSTCMKYMNYRFVKLLGITYDSKMSDINKTSTGKTFDAIKDITNHETTIMNIFISGLQTVVPFLTLMGKECQMGIAPPIITISFLIVSVVILSLSDKLFKFDTAAKEAKANITTTTVDNFMNLKTLKYLNKRAYTLSRLFKAHEAGFRYLINYKKIIFWGFSMILMYAPTVINIYLVRNSITMIATIVMFDWAVDNMVNNMVDIVEQLVELKAQKKVIKDLKGDDTIDTEILNDDESIILDNVNFDYGEESVKFHIDHLEFKNHDRYLITGESGEGKSSLANLIVGAILPTTGEVKRYKTFYVYQETEMLNTTLWENIVFDNPEGIIEEDVICMINDLGLSNWFKDLPKGFNTLIGEKGCKLSSGQKQRFNIIRALLSMKYHPEYIYILDEITSNLDIETEKKAIKLIDESCKSLLILISHHGGFNEIVNNIINVRDHKFNIIK